MPLYPGSALYPGSSLFPAGQAIGPVDTSGNPTGFDESGWWGSTDNSRPDGLRWLAVDLLTGVIVCDLPGVVSSDPTRRTLMKYESMSAGLVVTDKTSPSWLAATTPFRCALIAYRGDPGSEVIYWGGIVLRRQRPVGSSTAQLTLATVEAYTDRRYTGPYTTDPSSVGAKRSQNTVVSDLITQFVTANHGLPITVKIIDNGDPVPTVLATYNDYDDKTVYSNLGALTGLLNGPEWTGHWEWNRTTNRILPVFYVGNRIGSATPDGLAPRAWFDSANLISGTLDENYSSGMGANLVTATSSGQGLARPQATSPLGTPNYRGRPRVEYRYSPSTSILDPLTLQQHADNAYGLLADGTNTVTLRATNQAGHPQYGVDWNLGDDIGFELTGPLFPGGYQGTGRVIGYEADDYYTSPVLYVPDVS